MFTPDYRNLVLAARNRRPPRPPLYEHLVSDAVMERILGTRFRDLAAGDDRDRAEYFRQYCRFFLTMGYDTVSWEGCVGQVMPGSGCLGGHREPAIRRWEDFQKYPWDRLPERYAAAFDPCLAALAAALPPGMKAVGGVGNGVFECVQEVVGYENLCYIAADDPRLYEALFRKAGEALLAIWTRFLRRWGGVFCVARFGDDLGFKSGTLLSPGDIRRLIIPEYRRIIALIHGYGLPFLLHSCGDIFAVMPGLIDTAGIDAKHSNEDQIALFPVWVERYGARIGNFGGLDMDTVCRCPPAGIRLAVTDLWERLRGLKDGGLAFGTGNSIPDYVPADHYAAMVAAFRELRGDGGAGDGA